MFLVFTEPNTRSIYFRISVVTSCSLTSIIVHRKRKIALAFIDPYWSLYHGVPHYTAVPFAGTLDCIFMTSHRKTLLTFACKRTNFPTQTFINNKDENCTNLWWEKIVNFQGPS